ncbi:general transcription factor 3C polypeptide 5 [Diachasmimorpha longicaudata]|uniref:general transcription factor 3C polypeptide 5 n=1 Tax=Diachasmimorpha longicaudata TaxID=58733 RepID=UPI0030B877E2
MEGGPSDNDNCSEKLDDDVNDKDFDINEFVNQSGDSDEDDNQCEEETQNVEEDEEESEETVYPGGHRLNKKFICIRYPGNVINADKAVETLGGISAVSTAITTSNRRLELRLRPADGFCKPACGDRHPVTGFLLRIRVKKSRVNQVMRTNLERASQARPHESAMPKDPLRPVIEDEIEDVTKYLRESSIDPADTSKRVPFPGQCDQNESTSKFDKFKCEDLSGAADYRLPKLKILGRVETEFRFTNLSDFQYLPVTRSLKDPKVNECIYEKIHPVGIPPYKWLESKVPYFFPPAVFSRMDTVQAFSLKTDAKESGQDHIIGKTRKRRAGLSNYIHFTTTTIPTGPPRGMETAMKVKFLNTDHLEKLKALFEERPIWSKNALAYKTNYTNEQLKILLPSCAYYFLTGPWRIMWTKLGYDPRKDPSARKYQTLDYRLKSMHGLEQNVKGKRTYSNYILPYKSANAAKSRTAVLRTMDLEGGAAKGTTKSDDIYIYREGTIPPSRQMFYQYCDVLSEEIQGMLDKLPDPLPGTKCHEKRGWLPSGFSDQCREIINRQVKAVLRKKMNIPEDHPTTLPRKRRSRLNLRLPFGKNEKRRKLVGKKSSEKKRKCGNSSNESDPDWEDN